MPKLLTVTDIATLIKTVGIQPFFKKLIDYLHEDFDHWQAFEKSPRHATHYPQGVIELMPISGKTYYAYKYVNGHPQNPKQAKLTVAATGQLSRIDNGYPVLICEMTLLTAVRTAATSALAARYLAKPNAKTMALIGTGSQGEFQALAFAVELGIKKIRYFDIDTMAMKKFAHNLESFDFELTPCRSVEDTIQNAEIMTTATADKNRLKILRAQWIQPGAHINAVGGDCPGKTELDSDIFNSAKIVVEFLEQSLIEGEIQGLDRQHVYAELWQLVQKQKPGRENDDEITIFDSVGFAIEDHAVLRLVYDLAEQYQLGRQVDLIPELADPKNLFSLLK